MISDLHMQFKYKYAISTYIINCSGRHSAESDILKRKFSVSLIKEKSFDG